jgi:hypothetical protein
VGILLVFLAALFFVQYVFQFVGPVGKVSLSYLGAAVLFGIALLTKEKYPPFAGVVGAGAWAVTYLVTYAMHFFPATRLITSPLLAMLLLTLVVAALVIIALYQRTRWLVAMGLVLGFLTMILSPLSLFSIVGTVLLLGVFAVLAVKMPWGDLILPAAIGAYVSYFFWFANVLGRLPVQGGGLLEKQFLGLIALTLLWLFICAVTIWRQDEEEALGGQVDSLTLILATVSTAVLGLFALDDLVLTLTTQRLARAIWLLLLACLAAGGASLAYAYRAKRDVAVTGGISAMVLLLASIAYFLPERSSSTTLAWAVAGVIIGLGSIFIKNSWVAVLSTLPSLASAIRFLVSDLQRKPVPLTAEFSLHLPVGLVLSLVLVGGATMLRMIDLSDIGDRRAQRLLPAILLVMSLVVFYAMTGQEFSGAVPSVLWGVAGLVMVVAGFLAHWQDARVIGLGGLAVTVGRVFVHDLQGLDALPRVISFAILGGLLLLVGYGYNRNKDKLQKYLTEE